ncbi:hypothetical protein [Haloarcula sp. 1CSR25-25]|nr:hypothetical protein [Haloarcula sp. 1CSR25-25]
MFEIRRQRAEELLAVGVFEGQQDGVYIVFHEPFAKRKEPA